LFLYHDLISALVERWRRETHIIYFHVGEMTPILQDVVVIPVNLLIDGTPVASLTAFNKDDLCLCLLGQVPPHEGYKGDYIRLTWLNESFKTPPKGATKIVLYYYAKA